MNKRVVITGMGIASAVGNNCKTFFNNLCNQKSGIDKIDIFDTSKYKINIGATVKDIKDKLKISEQKLPRSVQFAIHSTRNALEMSGILDSVPNHKIGCYLAGPSCQLFEAENFFKKYLKNGIENTKTSDLYEVHWDNLVNTIARKFKLFGPRNTFLTACSSSGLALGLAYDLIKLGEVSAMVTGGSDGFSEFTYSGFQTLNSASDEPCQPFDQHRKGLNFGEGAGILILEDYELAKKRGANILAEIVGYGAIGEAYNLTAPHPDAIGYKRSINMALEMGKINPSNVSHINSHGTATSANDLIESNAINEIFNNNNLPVNSIKSLVGHCMGAAGAVEAINCILNLMNQIIPGTLNMKKLDPEVRIKVISETLETKLDYVLSNSAGFGGNNASVLFKRFA